MLRRIVQLKAGAGGRSLFSQLAANVSKVRNPVPGAQPVREGQAGGEWMAGCTNRCAPPLSEFAGTSGGRRGCRCTDPLFRAALAGKGIDRPATRHATFAESPVAHR